MASVPPPTQITFLMPVRSGGRRDTATGHHTILVCEGEPTNVTAQWRMTDTGTHTHTHTFECHASLDCHTVGQSPGGGIQMLHVASQSRPVNNNKPTVTTVRIIWSTVIRRTLPCRHQSSQITVSGHHTHTHRAHLSSVPSPACSTER